jgi:hypothetical protein
MLTLFVVLGLMPVLVFTGLTAQHWLFSHDAQKPDHEWELYQQSHD